jgi:hypothetical protein
MCAIMSVYFGLVALAGHPGFVPVANDGGVRVYEHKGAAAVEMLAVAVVDATPAEVLAVLLDYDNYARLNPRLGESRILKRTAHDLMAFQRLKLPVIKDRVYVLHVGWRTSVDGKSDIRFGLVPELAPNLPDTVRMPILAGRWELEPVAGGTRITYFVQMTLGEGVPNLLVADGAVREIPQLFKNLRDVLKERHAEVALHHQGY